MIELPKLSGMSDDERADEQALVRWATFLAAETDAEVDDAAKEDTMIEKAKDILEYLSKEPDARELARLRQEAQIWYRMDLDEEGRLGEIRAKRAMLLMLLDQRDIALNDEQRQTIESCDDATQIDGWFRTAVTAQNAQEVFG
jgi:hypothetical protein